LQGNLHTVIIHEYKITSNLRFMNLSYLIFSIGSCILLSSTAMAQTPGNPATNAASSVAAAVADAQSVGVFKQVQGQAWQGPAQSRRVITPGEPVLAGERLRTGRNGTASLTLKDGTVLTLGPDTSVDLTQFNFNTTTQEGSLGLDLLQGTLRVVTGLLAKVNPERFRISTPTAVVGVRGTDFIVEARLPLFVTESSR
jgi:hypothetical protein